MQHYLGLGVEVQLRLPLLLAFSSTWVRRGSSVVPVRASVVADWRAFDTAFSMVVGYVIRTSRATVGRRGW